MQSSRAPVTSAGADWIASCAVKEQQMGSNRVSLHAAAAEHTAASHQRDLDSIQNTLLTA